MPVTARGEDPRRRHAPHPPDSLALGRVPPASRHGAERSECCGGYAASMSRGHCCGRTLPGPANRLRELAFVLLQRRPLFDPDRKSEKSAWSSAVLGPAGITPLALNSPRRHGHGSMLDGMGVRIPGQGATALLEHHPAFDSGQDVHATIGFQRPARTLASRATAAMTITPLITSW